MPTEFELFTEAQISRGRGWSGTQFGVTLQFGWIKFIPVGVTIHRLSTRIWQNWNSSLVQFCHSLQKIKLEEVEDKESKAQEETSRNSNQEEKVPDDTESDQV